MKPIKIKRESEGVISITWDDANITKYAPDQLRDKCPCAGCQGETILFKTYEPVAPKIDLPGKYEIKSIVPIGNYAIQIIWGDGHDTGIFSWDYLRNLCGEHDCHNHCN
jgi:DUF971 family protein